MGDLNFEEICPCGNSMKVSGYTSETRLQIPPDRTSTTSMPMPSPKPLQKPKADNTQHGLRDLIGRSTLLRSRQNQKEAR